MAAPSAEATTVTFGLQPGGVRVITIADANGVADKIGAGASAGGIDLTDPSEDGKTLVPGTGCREVDSTTIRCAEGLSEAERAAVQIEAFLGGGDDRYDSAPILNVQRIFGGPGNDSLTPRAGSGTLNGEDGDDVLGSPDPTSASGAPTGGYTMNGGLGRDTLNAMFYFAPTTVSGGAGEDTVSYLGRGQGVRVDLRLRGGDGSVNENDDVSVDVERIIGTDFNDGLVAGPANVNNELIGNLGSDELRGGDGFDRLVAGGDGVPDSVVDCGPEPFPSKTRHDEAVVDLIDAAPAGCEVVESAPFDEHPTVQLRTVGRVRLSGRAVRVRLTCPRAARRTCVGTLVVRTSGRTVASTRHRLRTGRSRTFRLRLPAALARRVRIRPRTAVIEAREKAGDGRPKRTTSRIRLTA